MPGLAWPVQYVEESGQLRSEIGPIVARVVLDVERERLALEDAGVFGEEAEQDADEQTLQVVSRVAAGFEGIALMDHLAPPLAEQHYMWEAMALAGWLLARTESLTVGHLVLCDPLRHPTVLARQAATLDHASGGRFELGIGWGSVPDELVTFGVDPVEPRRRVERLGESLEVIRALWTGEPVDYDGEWFHLRGAQQRPAPSRMRKAR